MTDQPHERLDFDHLDFAQACQLCDTLQAALVAMASYTGDTDKVDRMALLYGRAELRKAEAFREYEQSRRAGEDAKL